MADANVSMDDLLSGNLGDDEPGETETPETKVAEAAPSTTETKKPDAKADDAKTADQTKTATAADAKTEEAANGEGDDAGDDDDSLASKRKTVPVAAHVSEKKKRQAAEREAAELRGRLSALEQLVPRPQQENAGQRQKNEDETYWDNPRQWHENQLRQERWESSLELLKESNPDADELISEFVEAAKKNPALAHEFRNSKLPAHHAYKTAKALRVAKSMEGDPEKWRENERKKIRDEERAAARKELALATAENVPKSNVTASGAGGKTAAGEDDDELTLGEIFDGR